VGGRQVVGQGWRRIKHMPQYTLSQKSVMKAVTVTPNHSTVLHRCLAVVGANFRSTASNWCPSLVPIAHLSLYRSVNKPSGKADQFIWANGNIVHRYFLCVGISLCNKISFNFGAHYAGFC